MKGKGSVNSFLFLALLFIQSVFVILYLVFDNFDLSLTLGAKLIILSSVASLFFIQVLFINFFNLFINKLILENIFRFKRSVLKLLKVTTLTISSLIIPSFLILDNIHYKFMGFRLGVEQFILIFDGAKSDMSPLKLKEILIFSSFFILWGVLVYFSVFKYFTFKHTFLIKSFSYIVSFMFLGFLIDTAFGAIDQEAYELKKKFLWGESNTKEKTNVPHQGFLGDISFTDLEIRAKANERIAKSKEVLIEFNKLKSTNNIKKPNILFLVVEALRKDMFTKEYMPLLYSRKQEWMVLNEHFSSGANSGSGDFGLISGLYSYYFYDYKKLKESPLPFKILKSLGYELSIYFSNSMRYENIYETFFEPEFDKTIHPPEMPQPEWDIELVNAYNKNVTKNKAPWFNFLRIYAPHYSFYYPKEFEIYTPTASSELNLKCGAQSEFKEHKVGLKNRYLNSVRFTDSLIDSILSNLEKQGRFEDTIIVILGDHGEEFWEKGKFGHVFDLNEEQIQTTALIRFPDMFKGSYRNLKESAYKYTSHSDIFPSIFHLMGLLELFDENVFDGKSLLKYEVEKDFITASTGLVRNKIPRKHIVVKDNTKVYFNTTDQKVKIDKVTSLNDKLLKDFSRKEVKELLLCLRKKMLN